MGGDREIDVNKIMLEDVEIIDIDGSHWNCDKCIFFKPEDCECMATKRFLFSQALGDDCNDCKRPFVLRQQPQPKMDKSD